ncbi:zinc finger protein 423 isoform X2 [Periplaneta americana]|uniref:zinc finger protein 423 isoform X2 n=1 Tax=Periplaneta americana TaxID=6978 RepID=UPI0037E9524F
MLFKGNSSRLELLIEKIQANKENHNVSEQDIKDALGTDPGSSWRSETPEDQTSPSPSSCATPNSATDVPDAELTFTVGVTEGTPYACQFCDKAFPRLSYLKKHEQTHSDQMPFRCEFCSRLFKHKRSRDRHIKLHTGDKKYRCTHCEAAFSRSDHLKIHMKTHDNQKPFQCTVCNRGYNTAAALTSHMQNHKKDQQQQQQQNGHNNSNSSRTSSNNTPSPGAACPSFRCLQCGETFRKPEELQGHMMTQHNVETGGSPPGQLSRGLLGGLMLGDSPLARSPSRPLPFPTPKLACIYCTKDSFTTMEALQLHVQAMHGSILNGELRDFAGLTQHQASPSPSLTPHHLLTSPNGGGSSSSNNHTVTSTSLMPYSCELCTMRFGTVQGLQKHALAVHGLMGGKDHHSETTAGLFCVQCSLSFPSAALFAEHYVLMHGSSSMIPSSPAPEQLKPTDLSKKAHRHSQHHEERSPAKRHKTSVENTAPPAVAMPDTPTSASSMVNQYEHAGTLLCNQCSAALPDFESFRTHLKSHLEEAGGLRGLLGGGSDLMGMLSSQDSRVSNSKSPASAGALACPHCGAKFSGADDHQAFEQHVATHFMATATEYGCQSCLKLFPKPDELQKHLMDIHAHHLYRCSLCKEMFDSKVAIQVHFAVKHSNECKLYKCTACPSSSAVFRSELDFGLHVRSAHAPLPLLAGAASKNPAQQPFRCLFCRLSFATELEMQFHLAAHSKQFHCPLCQEAFHVEFLLDKHMQTHHSSQVMNANGTSSAENLSQQQKSPKSKASGVTPSSTALTNSNNSSASSNSTSRNSSNNVESGSSKKGDQASNNCCCDICDRCDFGSEAELVAHRKLVHHIKPTTGKNGAVSLHCAYCSENCKSRTELENHMKTHSQGSSGSGKHKCNICDELCPSAAVLAEHKLTHCKVISGSTCTQCKATLISEEQFYTHLQQHSSNNNNNSSAQTNTNSAHQQVVLPTPCVVCRQTLISDIEVRMHARFHLKNSAALTASEPMYQCCLCLKQFEMQNLIVAGGSNGVVPSVQGATYVCKDCYHCHSKASPSQQQQTSQQQQQQLGHALQQQEQAYRCSECQVKFETSSALESHLVSVHRKTYQCIKCQVSFETEREIQMHVATHLLTEGSSHECHLCRRMLATPLKLQAHLIEHTFAGCGSFTCYLCSAVFTAAQGLQQHMLEHGLAARPYDCSRCSLRFFFRAELDNHSYSHLEEDAVAMANPSVLLDGDMASKAAYYHHMSANGTYETSTPDMHYYKTLVQESSKQQKHKSNKSHSSKGGALLKCLECNKEFSSILGLQAHQRHHKQPLNTNKKVYTCNECGKEFGMARNLSVHMRSHHEDHNGEERVSEDLNIASEEQYQSEGSKTGSTHACILCRKDFPDAETLESHVASQHFRCQQCGEIFVRQRHLAEHIRKVHSVEEDQYITGDHVATDINPLEMKQEPITIKEENEDENIDVSSLTPTAEQQFAVSPEHHSGEQADNRVTNSQGNEPAHLNIQSHPSSPNGAKPNSGANNNDDDGRSSSSPAPPGDGDSVH